MKLISLVVLLVVYRNLQTDLEWPVPTPRYTWPNMAFHAYSPDLAPNMKGMMTLTYDLDLVRKYLGQTSFSHISDPDFLFDSLYIMGSISNRYGACIGHNTTRTVTFTLLTSQLNMTVPE